MLLPPHWRQVARERRSQVHKLLKIACLLDDEVCTSPGTHLNPSVCSQFSSFLLCGLSVKKLSRKMSVVAYGNWYRHCNNPPPTFFFTMSSRAASSSILLFFVLLYATCSFAFQSKATIFRLLPKATAAAVPSRLIASMSMSPASSGKGEIVRPKRVGIIGGGAAGLATARAFLRENELNQNTEYDVTVLESRDSIGGIWKYEDQTKTEKNRPMYRNLRTNLPKELMAYKELPWGGTGKEASYVTHKDVLEYLQTYANKFDLLKCINFRSSVKQLKVLDKEQISLEWTTSTGETHTDTFDNICICNGHYARASIPKLEGLDDFRGSIIHAIEYDNSQPFAGKTVLCVGAKPSGLDISREIGLVAKHVYLSDSACDKMQAFGNVSLVPRMQSVDENSGIHFSSPRSTEEHVADDIDAIVFCSGYDYDFPFINEDSNLELTFSSGERRVQPLYEQTWHARHPSISFIGIPHSIVPFPLCEIQASAVVSQTRQQIKGIPLPCLSDRLAAASEDAASGGPNGTRVQDTHNLASKQWDFSRKLAKISGDYDEEMEKFIATNKAIYERSGKERKFMIPGGEDIYRETRFRRDEENQSYEILYSEESTV